MPEGELPERPRGTLTTEQTTQPGQAESGRSHEQLVKAFRDLIKQNAEVYADIRSPHEREVLPAEAIVRTQLDWYSAPNTGGETAFTLRSAWDALAYDRYEAGSREEGLAGSLLQAYYGATHEPTIKLTDPGQVRALDAMTEAVGIPHQRGKTDIEIPEKLRNYNKYLLSDEYRQRVEQAQAKRNTRQLPSK
jgi:hypothetical protein